jgi:hypothetical protein
MNFSIIDHDSTGTEEALPVSLIDFSATLQENRVMIRWQTASETENRAFRIYRNGDMLIELEGAGCSSEPRFYSWTDLHIVPGRTYTYVLADVGMDNMEKRHHNMAESIKVTKGNVNRHYSVNPACPNPFNPQTKIPLNLTKGARVGVRLCDVSGHTVPMPDPTWMGPGSHTINIDGSKLGTGIYLVYIRIDDDVEVQKIVLMK